MSEERLQKILARAGVASRRKAEELIREGRVTINGRVAEIGDKADLEHDAVKMDARRIQPPAGHRYLLLNKPRGVMSTLSDPAGRPTVIDLVPPGMRRALVPVGRLDFQTEGLLLLTDDGELAQHVAHPSRGCWKTYEVKVRGLPDSEQIERLRAGIVLEGRRTAPCRIAPLRRRAPGQPAARRGAGAARAGGAGTAAAGQAGGAGAAGRGGAAAGPTSSWWSVELGEGRTRQIREMFQRIGHPVQKLRRIAIGPISDPDMPVGSLRELSEREVAALRKAGPPKAGGAPRRAAAGAGRSRSGAARSRSGGGRGGWADDTAAEDEHPSGGERRRSAGSARRTGGAEARSAGRAERTAGSPSRTTGHAERTGGTGRRAARGAHGRPAHRGHAGLPARLRQADEAVRAERLTGGRTSGRRTAGGGLRAGRPSGGRPAGGRPSARRTEGGGGGRSAGGWPTPRGGGGKPAGDSPGRRGGRRPGGEGPGRRGGGRRV